MVFRNSKELIFIKFAIKFNNEYLLNKLKI